MKILGLQLGHNATATLLIDGELKGAVSQEKFDNIKNSAVFPEDAIIFLLKEFNIDKIDGIFVAGKFMVPQQLFLSVSGGEKAGNPSVFKRFLSAIFFQFSGYQTVRDIYWKYIISKQKRAAKNSKPALFKKLAAVLDITEAEATRITQFVEHHVCHSYAAFYGLNKDKNERALIFTLDGSGDYYCATVNIYEDGKIKRLASTKWLHSLGYIYSHVTTFLGMKPLEHEYKVMGLAPYAKESYVRKVYERHFKPILWLRKDNPLVFNSFIPTNYFSKYLRKNLVGERFDNIAGAVQMLTEELVVNWIKEAIKKTGIGNIYTGGGVFMNVKMNKKIMEMPEVESVYFMPSCGDESNPLGAVFYAYKNIVGKDPEPLKNIYLGPEYSNEEIEKFIKENKLGEKYKVEKVKDMEKKIAQMISQFQVVARFSGRAEWGARALGNRSILANPSDMKSFYEVNDMIKQRDFWMPFAPSILEEDMDRYIKNPKKIEAAYMILAFDSTEEGAEKLRAALHQSDKTLRAQIVTKEQSPDYWKLINYFKELTGIGGVLNTSFNLHGYPLVATLEQALFTLENSGLKHLALGNFLISKK